MTTERTLTIEIDTPFDEDGDASWLTQTPRNSGGLEPPSRTADGYSRSNEATGR
jgi:hypothetical protein